MSHERYVLRLILYIATAAAGIGLIGVGDQAAFGVAFVVGLAGLAATTRERLPRDDDDRG